jgi:hypothetical protein
LINCWISLLVAAAGIRPRTLVTRDIGLNWREKREWRCKAENQWFGENEDDFRFSYYYSSLFFSSLLNLFLHSNVHFGRGQNNREEILSSFSPCKPSVAIPLFW